MPIEKFDSRIFWIFRFEVVGESMNSRSSCLLRQFIPSSSPNTHQLNKLTVRHGTVSFKRFSNFAAARIRPYSTIQKVLEESPTESNERALEIQERTRRRQSAVATRRQPPKQWNVLAGVLLSRPPILVPEPHPFEAQLIRYQKMLDQHHYTQFPINFFFKKGSIGEKRWLMEHPVEPKKSGSGILRPLDPSEPQWILGGNSDHNVFRVRSKASVGQRNEPTQPSSKKKRKDDFLDKMDERERRTLEQYAALEEKGLDKIMTTEPPPSKRKGKNKDEIYRRLDRKPRETLYCLVKNSVAHQKRLGRPDEKRTYGPIEHWAFSVTPGQPSRSLDVVRSLVLCFHALECAMGALIRYIAGWRSYPATIRRQNTVLGGRNKSCGLQDMGAQ